MQQEATADLARQRLDALVVFRRAQRRHHQRLRLASLEDRRTVRPRQRAHFDRDGSHLVVRPASDAPTIHRQLAHVLVLEVFVDGLDHLLFGRVPLAQLGLESLLQLLRDVLEGPVALVLVADGVALGDAVPAQRSRPRLELGVLLHHLLDLAHRHAQLGPQLVLNANDVLAARVRELQRLHHVGLGDLFGPALDHHDGFLGARHHDVDVGLLALLGRRVRDELAIDAPHSHPGDGAVEGNVGHPHRRRGPTQAQHVGVVLLVRRDDAQHDLRVVRIPLGEQRPAAPVDEPARQGLFLRQLALAAEVPTGDTARRVHVFLVLDRQRQEVDVSLVLRADRGGENHRVAVPHHRRAVGLLGQATCLDDELALADHHALANHCHGLFVLHVYFGGRGGWPSCFV